ncbi:hypothetical protein BBK36DRAFT_1127530, partial [Trichoderma citrinoviride]
KKAKTYNSRCSLVVTHPTTNLPVSGLSMGEQTGPRVFHYLWSYVLGFHHNQLISTPTLVQELCQLRIKRTNGDEMYYSLMYGVPDLPMLSLTTVLNPHESNMPYSCSQSRTLIIPNCRIVLGCYQRSVPQV